jgi:hypothetical protein
MARITLTALLICLGVSICFGQDSAKKTVVVKPKTSKYQSNGYHHYRYDSLKVKMADSAAHALSFTDKSLNGQYQYLLTKVYHYQQPLIAALWKNASDTVNANRSKLQGALGKLNAQKKIIDSLKSAAGNQADDASVSSNQIDLLGISFPQTIYNFIVWGLIALFGIIAIIVIGRSGSYRREAKYRVQLYNELEDEFKTYKTKANDKEKKLARELQTERNKLDELLGRG